MAAEIRCLFYRGADTDGNECDIGYCDLDYDRSLCGGEISFCERPDALRKYLVDQKRKWEKRRNLCQSRG